MKPLYRFFASPKLALILLLSFSIAMAAATFIENDFGTPVAWQLIYDSFWFELIMLGLALSFVASIIKYKLWIRQKWPLLLFHLAFIVILLGAAVTRYTSTGGVMRIREGESSNVIISDQNYITIHVKDSVNNQHFQQHLDVNALTDADFQWTHDGSNGDLKVELLEFIPDATISLAEEQEGGEPILELVVTEGEGRRTVLLKMGETEYFGSHNHGISLNTEVIDSSSITLIPADDSFKLYSPEPLDFFVMATQNAGALAADSLHTIGLRTLYRSHDLSFVPLQYMENGKIDLRTMAENPGENDEVLDDALRFKLSLDEQTRELFVLYRQGFLPMANTITLDDYEISMSYGSRAITLPFAIHLDDFQLERYPGSTSPSSYASEVVIKDGEQDTPFRIYMNNVLDHKGYRFYQASYDTDELGTVLAVNRDRPGTYITYLGYLLMGLGMFLTLFGKGSHFWALNKKLQKNRKKLQAASVLLIMMLSNVATGQDQREFLIPDQRVAADFGRILVQDLDGRIKPVNSLASEFLRKLARKTYLPVEEEKYGIEKLNADQVFLSLHMVPDHWQGIPIIKVDRKKLNSEILSLLPQQEGLLAFNDFLNPEGQYLLGELVEKANAKKPAERGEADKEVLNIDERFNIVFNILQGNYLKIFPNKNDPNDTWFSPAHHFRDFNEEDAVFAQNILPLFYADLGAGDLKAASERLDYIRTYQQVLAEDIIPSEQRVNAELWYNELNLNFWMFQFLFTIGPLLLIVAMVRIFKGSKAWAPFLNVLIVISLVGFLAFTGNILLRWYVAGHAPWSNGYEMLVFVAWVLWLCGFLTFRKSDFALPLASLFSGALLFVSYLDWLNPEITNLMPVLKSYWLKVHVATIVSSYAPLALSAIIGFMVLVLMVMRTDKTSATIDGKIKELTYINEISMTIGLFVLAVGTFLGGIWANESWGRYWAWDPKETWALISIIIYAVVLHLRLVPGWYNAFVVNAAAMFAFWSIIMTSFGVNYYLSGLHSYAAGDPMPIPDFVYILAFLMIAITFAAWMRYGKRVRLRL